MSHRPGESFSCVKTDTFVKSLKQCCNERNDEWASDVRGRIEYCSGDLHAADSVYHNSCDSNFRLGGGLPAQFTQCNNVLESEPEIKRKRPGRPENEEQSQAFAKLCALIETNDERQWTILELCEYMASFPEHPDIGSYSSKWMKEKLKSYFGDSIVFSQKEGLGDVITLRETTHKILRTFYENTRTDSSDEGKKIAMISATIKFLRNDTISNVETVNDSYPKSSELSLASALDCLPDTVRYFCEGLISGKETKQKVASLGQAIVQAIRPRAVIAPLQLGLAVQLHYHLTLRSGYSVICTYRAYKSTNLV
ncbi:hypothetical protein SNE40_018279 [Patella caerulea]|uniref:Uncharacterized protein n=1 Tax=Patella caerulea TaxID=87958 RepID=A0AAN8PKA2_PATCE